MTDHAAPAVLSFEDVRKRYGDVAVLNGISMEVRRQQVVCLIGPCGSGESTLLRYTNWLEPIDSGAIRLDGEILPRDRRKLRGVRRRMGMVFQNFELFPHRTVLANVLIGPMTVLRLPRAEADARARALLEKVGLSDKANSYPANLSGGQRQRVGCQVIEEEPPSQIFDAPLVDAIAERASTRGCSPDG